MYVVIAIVVFLIVVTAAGMVLMRKRFTYYGRLFR